MMREMKDSGVEWIGEIPVDWALSKISEVYQERNSKVSDIDYMPLSVTKQGIVPQLDSAAKSDNSENRKLIKKNDFVINSRSDRRGSCGISDYDGSCSLINIVISPRRNMHNKYYSFLFRSELFAHEFYRWGNGIVDDLWSTKWASMKRIYIPLPPLLEQQKIADYLDDKCTQIDSIIEREQVVIEKLKAYKQSLITETVTKGLNPDAPMKDSGIEWIGNIPEHWGTTILLALFKEHKLKNKGNVENNLLSLSYGKIIKRDISSNEGLLPASFESYNIVESSYIVFRLTDLQNDKKSLRTGLCKERGIITSAYVTIAPIAKDSSEYMHFLFHSYDICKVFYGMGDGVRQSMTYQDLKKIRVIRPPLVEQEAIANFLDQKCSAIDEAIIKKQSLIEKLNEYKKSLIYEVVTGKKEV